MQTRADEQPYISPKIRTWLADVELVLIHPSVTGAEAAAYFDYIHGLYLHPGIAGEAPLPEQSALVITFLSMAQAAFKAGDYFPVWGTCQGFEQMIQYIGAIDTLDQFDSKEYYKQVHGDISMMNAAESRLLHWAPPRFLHQTYIPYFNHTEGISLKRFNASKLKDIFRILALAHDRAGDEYVAFIEGFKMPWYGCQFHPEAHRPLSDTRWMVEFLKSELAKSTHNGFDPLG
jgi:anthranilate/para-aminobenzoate synthase component II